MIAFRSHDEQARPVDCKPSTRNSIRDEAAYRRLSVEGLVGQILDRIADEDRYAEILDGGAS